MTVAVVTLAVALAAALTAVGYLAVRLGRVTPELVEAGKAQVAEAERAHMYQEERDDAVRQLAVTRSDLAAANVRIKLESQRANAAAEEFTRDLVQKIKNAPTAAPAAAAVDQLLGAPLPGVQAGDASAGRDSARPAAVQPAGPAAAGGPRRPG